MTGLAGFDTLFPVFVRLGTVLLAAPTEALRLLPARIRFLLVFGLCITVANTLPVRAEITGLTTLLETAMAEAVNGLVMAFGLMAAFSALRMAGRWTDLQAGLDSASLFNPLAETSESWMTRLLGLLATSTFFTLDGHHTLLSALAASFRVIPPGTCVLVQGLRPLMQGFALTWAMALTMATPVVSALLLLEAGSALLTRNMPGINLWFLTLPLKITICLALSITCLPMFTPFCARMFEIAFSTWEGLAHG